MKSLLYLLVNCAGIVEANFFFNSYVYDVLSLVLFLEKNTGNSNEEIPFN